MSVIPCFLLVPDPVKEASLRVSTVYRGIGHCNCDAEVQFGTFEGDTPKAPPLDDPRWPTECSRCGYVFTEGDLHTVDTDIWWIRADGQPGRWRLGQAPIGAMWDAYWLSKYEHWQGPDNKCLVVRTPGGDWTVDGTCNNCTDPCSNCQVPYLHHGFSKSYAKDSRADACPGYKGKNPDHACWPRVGVAPNITVAKHYGKTCSAGGGSIQAGAFHGFLVNGNLVIQLPPTGFQHFGPVR